jgi:hypothetical protein
MQPVIEKVAITVTGLVGMGIVILAPGFISLLFGGFALSSSVNCFFMQALACILAGWRRAIRLLF